MPVVHIVERLSPGGIETFVLDMLHLGSPADSAFSMQGTLPDLLSGWPVLHDIADRIEAFNRRPGVELALIGRMARRLRAKRPRAVILHHLGPLLYGGLAARLAGIRRLIYVEHDAWHYARGRDRTLAYACFRLLSPTVIAVSEQVRSAVSAITPGIPIAVIAPGIATDQFIPGDRRAARGTLGLDQSAKIVGTVGRLVPVKAQHILLQAMAQLPQDVICAIVGDGPELGNLRQLSHRLGLDGRVHFLGQRQKLWEIYPAFDVFCLPSAAEGMPRTVLEAQACGIPVVAAAVGGIPEAVYRHTGILVPSADPAAFARALSAILSRTGSSASPRDFIETHMSLAATVRRYEALYLP